ncbi:MAG: acetyl-CoA acetyltransferase [Actinobacteria bacterium]|uniref:Thiolase C-terminal domain-containing protein n=1 Tax=marine metagenome TaxID=408172 RepID=A0A381PZC8_9ZZZZ|nr:acetyl-CoA acetyltransferase [Actinomycetota bacterium]MCS5687363.1 hypothetical protein [Acidimicrobiales bacterium]MEC8921716.1 acetyl-CoA acetyltransferase [Actinomycetota bacterium]MED5553279.1 acetyl-CoA acetyltransferase [Actinomycetota bacterium]MEE3187812.1 acetyl-CoA acetyltransferase [Actinomycetota bacterium]|tara:strand:+ start:1132 stop:2319 length:1188 start_codon:yes stop_codon:yes gene_type:complete
MSDNYNLRGKIAVVGVGETTYYKHGQSPDPEFVLVLKAILAACDDAGINPKEIDGFCSYSNDRNDPPRLANALGLSELRYSNMQWTSGGGGAAAAVQNAAGAITAGSANVVVAYRGLAQGQFGRFGRSGGSRPVSGGAAYTLPYGMMSAAQMYAMRTTRFMYEHGVGRNAMRSIAMACYHHAQNNPRAVMNGRTLDADTYDASRWISEPYRLFDCCLENDGAAAMIITRSDHAMDLAKAPAMVLGAQQSGGHRSGATVENATDYVTSSFKPAVKYLYEQAGVTPQDVDVVQSYENFTGGVVMSLIEHGFCTYENVDQVLTFDNLRADGGNLPLNTSGGNLAECYMHGLGLQIEAVRQVRGESCNQVPDVKVALANAGPMVAVASTAIYGTPEALG